MFATEEERMAMGVGVLNTDNPWISRLLVEKVVDGSRTGVSLGF